MGAIAEHPPCGLGWPRQLGSLWVLRTDAQTPGASVVELDFLPLFKSAKLFFRPASPAPHPPPPTASWSVTALKLLPQLAPLHLVLSPPGLGESSKQAPYLAGVSRVRREEAAPSFPGLLPAGWEKGPVPPCTTRLWSWALKETVAWVFPKH